MKDSSLRLQDKTILLTGPFGGVTQAIMRTMTEFGASVAYVNDKAPNAGKFTDGVTEGREIHQHWGRAAHFNMPLDNEKQILEAMGSVTQSLGRADCLVDCSALGWKAEDGLAPSLMLVEKVLPFLQAKTRGRIVYVYEDPSLSAISPGLTEAQLKSLSDHIATLSKAIRGSSVTVNALTTGVTDDFLLKHEPKSPSLKKSFEALQKLHPGLKLSDFTDVAHGIVYLCSILSNGLTGHTLRQTQGFHL